MSREVPLLNDDRPVVLDEDVVAQLGGLDLWLIAQRVVGLADNEFVDLRNLIAGDSAVTKDGATYDLRRSNLLQAEYDLGGEELSFSDIDPLSPSASALRAVPHASSVREPQVKPFQLDNAGGIAFLPLDLSGELPNISADSIHNPATVLTLSHWPANRTPELYKANLSTESVFAYLDHHRGAPEADIVTTDHFDLDGVVSVYSFLAPEHAFRHRELLCEVARLGDFFSSESIPAHRVAYALNGLVQAVAVPSSATAGEAVAARFAAVLSEMGDVLDHPERYQALWREALADFERSEALLRHPATRIEEASDVDLAVFWLPDIPNASVLDYSQRYFGLSRVSFHNRTSRATVALVYGGAVEISQRYEGWVERVSEIPRPRRDLGAFARALQKRECSSSQWQYNGVEDIMPALKLSAPQSSNLSPFSVIAELRRFLALAPPAWQP